MSIKSADNLWDKVDSSNEVGKFISSETARVKFVLALKKLAGPRLDLDKLSDILNGSAQDANRLTAKEYASVLSNAVEAFGMEAIFSAFTKVRRAKLSGVKDLILVNQPTISDMLKKVASVSNALSSLERYSLVRRGSAVSVLVEDASEDSLSFITASLNIIEIIRRDLGDDCICGITLGFDEPLPQSLMERLPQVQVDMSPGTTKVLLDEGKVKQVSPTASPMLANSLEMLLKRSASVAVPPDTSEMIMNLIFEDPKMSLDDVAERMFISRRTLQRRMTSSGSKYTGLRDIALKELSICLLVCTNLSVQEICDELDFAELSSFYRAFRQWTEDTPASFRKRYRAKIAAQTSAANT